MPKRSSKIKCPCPKRCKPDTSLWGCILGYDKWQEYFTERGVMVPEGVIFRWADSQPGPKKKRKKSKCSKSSSKSSKSGSSSSGSSKSNISYRASCSSGSCRNSKSSKGSKCDSKCSAPCGSKCSKKSKGNKGNKGRKKCGKVKKCKEYEAATYQSSAQIMNWISRSVDVNLCKLQNSIECPQYDLPNDVCCIKSPALSSESSESMCEPCNPLPPAQLVCARRSSPLWNGGKRISRMPTAGDVQCVASGMAKKFMAWCFPPEHETPRCPCQKKKEGNMPFNITTISPAAKKKQVICCKSRRYCRKKNKRSSQKQPCAAAICIRETEIRSTCSFQNSPTSSNNNLGCEMMPLRRASSESSITSIDSSQCPALNRSRCPAFNRNQRKKYRVEVKTMSTTKTTKQTNIYFKNDSNPSTETSSDSVDVIYPDECTDRPCQWKDYSEGPSCCTTKDEPYSLRNTNCNYLKNSEMSKEANGRSRHSARYKCREHPTKRTSGIEYLKKPKENTVYSVVSSLMKLPIETEHATRFENVTGKNSENQADKTGSSGKMIRKDHTRSSRRKITKHHSSQSKQSGDSYIDKDGHATRLSKYKILSLPAESGKKLVSPTTLKKVSSNDSFSLLSGENNSTVQAYSIQPKQSLSSTDYRQHYGKMPLDLNSADELIRLPVGKAKPRADRRGSCDYSQTPLTDSHEKLVFPINEACSGVKFSKGENLNELNKTESQHSLESNVFNCMKRGGSRRMLSLPAERQSSKLLDEPCAPSDHKINTTLDIQYSTNREQLDPRQHNLNMSKQANLKLLTGPVDTKCKREPSPLGASPDRSRKGSVGNSKKRRWFFRKPLNDQPCNPEDVIPNKNSTRQFPVKTAIAGCLPTGKSALKNMSENMSTKQCQNPPVNKGPITPQFHGIETTQNQSRTNSPDSARRPTNVTLKNNVTKETRPKKLLFVNRAPQNFTEEKPVQDVHRHVPKWLTDEKPFNKKDLLEQNNITDPSGHLTLRITSPGYCTTKRTKRPEGRKHWNQGTSRSPGPDDIKTPCNNQGISQGNKTDIPVQVYTVNTPAVESIFKAASKEALTHSSEGFKKSTSGSEGDCDCSSSDEPDDKKPKLSDIKPHSNKERKLEHESLSRPSTCNPVAMRVLGNSDKERKIEQEPFNNPVTHNAVAMHVAATSNKARILKQESFNCPNSSDAMVEHVVENPDKEKNPEWEPFNSSASRHTVDMRLAANSDKGRKLQHGSSNNPISRNRVATCVTANSSHLKSNPGSRSQSRPMKESVARSSTARDSPQKLSQVISAIHVQEDVTESWRLDSSNSPTRILLEKTKQDKSIKSKTSSGLLEIGRRKEKIVRSESEDSVVILSCKSWEKIMQDKSSRISSGFADNHGGKKKNGLKPDSEHFAKSRLPADKKTITANSIPTNRLPESHDTVATHDKDKSSRASRSSRAKLQDTKSRSSKKDLPGFSVDSEANTPGVSMKLEMVQPSSHETSRSSKKLSNLTRPSQSYQEMTCLAEVASETDQDGITRSSIDLKDSNISRRTRSSSGSRSSKHSSRHRSGYYDSHGSKHKRHSRHRSGSGISHNSKNRLQQSVVQYTDFLDTGNPFQHNSVLDPLDVKATEQNRTNESSSPLLTRNNLILDGSDVKASQKCCTADEYGSIGQGKNQTSNISGFTGKGKNQTYDISGTVETGNNRYIDVSSYVETGKNRYIDLSSYVETGKNRNSDILGSIATRKNRISDVSGSVATRKNRSSNVSDYIASDKHSTSNKLEAMATENQWFSDRSVSKAKEKQHKTDGSMSLATDKHRTSLYGTPSEKCLNVMHYGSLYSQPGLEATYCVGEPLTPITTADENVDNSHCVADNTSAPSINKSRARPIVTSNIGSRRSSRGSSMMEQGHGKAAKGRARDSVEKVTNTYEEVQGTVRPEEDENEPASSPAVYRDKQAPKHEKMGSGTTAALDYRQLSSEPFSTDGSSDQQQQEFSVTRTFRKKTSKKPTTLELLYLPTHQFPPDPHFCATGRPSVDSSRQDSACPGKELRDKTKTRKVPSIKSDKSQL